MAYRGFSGGGFVGNHLTAALLETLRPAADNAGRHATVGDPTTVAAPYVSDGASWKSVPLVSADGLSLVSGDEIILPIGAGLVDTTVTATGTLPITALGRITPVNAAGSTTQTLPSAATAWALKPYGVVVLVQRGAGVPSFAAGGGDTLRATSGIGACVQYGMIAAQVQSATEWALA